MTINQLSHIFRRICDKVWDPKHMLELKRDVAETLCQLEMHFPPAFFDVMTHLLIHVVAELDLCGPVHARWMYPMEHYMKLLKLHVRTMYRPEASMALGYMKDETLGYMAEYMDIWPRMWNGDEDEGTVGEVLEGKGTRMKITKEQWDKAHLYVLRNTDIMRPWRE